jgi:UDP-N-acetylmuramoyl-tripeptide--D-alanyl-D-alanine ligase
VSLAAGLVLLVAAGVGSVRWLRVAQREHYLAGSVTRFEGRWFGARPVNLGLGLAAAALIVAGVFVPLAWLPAAFGLVVWPVGLGLRGHTSKLAWTRRLRTLAGVTAGLAVVVLVVAVVAGAGAVGAALVALLVPQLVDVAAWILAPVERRLLDPFVTKAKARLAQVSPDVVGITGSYGKTTTKQYLRALLAQQLGVL